MDTLVHFGGAVKALGDGKVGGYLITFGDATTPDLSAERDFFTADTDYGLEDNIKSAVYYAHGLDKSLKTRRLTVGEMKVDEVGVWVEGQLKMRDEYEKAVYKMAEDGKLGWSSGTATHLVTRKAIKTDGGTVHEILTWPLGIDASLTPIPADPRNAAFALKALPALLGMEESPAAKSAADLTITDQMALLEQEANEDFGNPDDPWDDPIRGRDVVPPNIFVYARGFDPGDALYQRTFVITDGNDVTWGDEVEVVRGTRYLPVTEDPSMPDNDDPPMMAGKEAQVDVAALKAMLRASMTLDDHAEIVRDAISGFATRTESLLDLSIKSGRAMSASRHKKLSQTYAGLMTAHTATAGHLAAINEMLLSTDPDAKKDVDDFAALRTRFVRLQSELLHMSG